jgi:F-type H+-transporting ATPase subunit b
MPLEPTPRGGFSPDRFLTSMEQAMQALGGLILKALPTLFLVLLLHFYLRAMFYGPMERVLRERTESTAGVKRLAEETFARAEARTREYEETLRNARTEIYREQEQARHAWREEQSKAAAVAREKVSAMVAEARRGIEMETETARRSLEAQAEGLGEEIAGAVLRRKPS